MYTLNLCFGQEMKIESFNAVSLIIKCTGQCEFCMILNLNYFFSRHLKMF